MEATESENIDSGFNMQHLQSFLNESELSTLSDEVALKINNYINTKYAETTKSVEHQGGNNKEFNEKHTELSQKIKSLHNEIENLKKTITNLETNNSTIKSLYDDEKQKMSLTLKKRDIEIEALKISMSEMSTQLDSAILTKSQSVVFGNELQIREISLKKQEKRNEDDRALLYSQISNLTNEVNTLTSELQTVQLNNNNKIINLEVKISETQKQLDLANNSIVQLDDVKLKLNNQIETLTQKLFHQREIEIKVKENYMKEINAQTNLADTYKMMKDDIESKTLELTDGFVELQNLLQNATERYGDLETKYNQCQIDNEELLKKKEEIITSLKTQLEHDNKLLKLANAEILARDISDNMSPTAAVASRILKSNKSLSQVYYENEKLSAELVQKREEIAGLKEEIRAVVEELENRAPILHKEKADYEQALESNIELTEQIHFLNNNIEQLEKDKVEASKLANYFSCENKRLINDIEDLKTQLCFLLKEIENKRGMSLPNGDCDSSHAASNITNDSDDYLSNTMLTFGDIQELQANNLKLLRKVRELADGQNKQKQNDNESSQSNETFESKIAEMTTEKENLNKKINDILQQRDMYKKLYHHNLNSKDRSNAGGEMEISFNKTENLIEKSNRNHTLELTNIEKKLRKNEQILKDLKQEYKSYKDEKIATQKKLYEQIANMRQEISDLKGIEDKYCSASEHKNEQMKLLDTNLMACKIEITSLEEKNLIYCNTISKYEALIQHLTEDIAKLQEINNSSDVKLKKYILECEKLKSSEKQVQKESELLEKERENNINIIKHLELIKFKLENKDSVNRKNLEDMLDDSISECAAIRRRLEEEQNRFQELTLHYETQLKNANQQILEQKMAADKMKNEIVKLHHDINKDKCNEELSKKLEIAVGTNSSDSSFDFINKNKYLENKLKEKDNIIKTQQEQIKISKEHIKHYCETLEKNTSHINNLNDKYKKYELEADQEIRKYTQEIKNLREHCLIIEAQLSMQANGETSTDLSMINDNDNIKEQLRDAVESLERCQIERDNAASQMKDLYEFSQATESKYERIMVLHTSNIQALTKNNVDMAELRKQNNDLVAIIGNYEKEKHIDKGYCIQLESLKTENQAKTSEVKNLQKYSLELKSQIQALSSQLSVTASAQQLHETSNEIVSDLSVSTINYDGIPSEQLIKIIESLRKENNELISKCDLFETDVLNLKSQLDIAQKHLENKTIGLTQQIDNSETNIVTVEKQSNILRILETQNFVRDSNTHLRSERDTHLARVDDFSKVVVNYEEKVSSLQNKVIELTAKCRSFEGENTLLKTDCIRWRNRANSLVENANKASPDDWKLLQIERDNLNKCLHQEKEKLKQLTDEYHTVLNEKAQLGQKYELLLRKHKSLDNDHKQLIEELSKTKNEVVRATEESSKLKSELKSATEIHEKLTMELSLKDTELIDTRNKESQIRKIARKYKTQYEELVEIENKNAAKNTGELEIAEMQSRLDAEKENIEKLKSDLASSIEKEEKAKQLLKVAKNRIVQLSETKNKFALELNETKTKLESMEQNNRDEQDVRLALIKSQYEGKLTRLEKEREESDKSKDVEMLMQKINQLQRQLASHASSSKPSNLDKTTNEPPTANIKPMTACAVAASTAGTVRRGGEPPLASIRPVAQVGPTAPHDAHSTEYMPASSSRMRADEADAAADPGPPLQQVALVQPRVEPPGATPAVATAPPADVSTSRAPDRPPKRPRPEPRGQVEKRARAEPDDYQLPTSSQRDRDDEVAAVDERVPAESDRPGAEVISSGTEPGVVLSPGADDGDDGIVPSTPTLYVPRRGDGFGEAAVSPAPIPAESGARFTFAEAGAASHHDTHADLALPAGEWRDEGTVSSQGSAPVSPRHVEEGREAEASAPPADARRRPRWPPLR